MPNTINADNGVTSGITGIRTTADNTGNLALQSNGVTVLTLATNNTATFANNVDITGTTTLTGAAVLSNTATATAFIPTGSTIPTNGVYLPAANIVGFSTNSTERMRINSSGEFLVGGTTTRNSTKATIENAGNTLGLSCSSNTNAVDFAIFYANAGTVCGAISRVGTTSAVVYSTTSDYRLKENIVPMIGALDSVSKLKPVNFTWKDGGVAANGFIALFNFSPQSDLS